jgi:hypothetical protein
MLNVRKTTVITRWNFVALLHLTISLPEECHYECGLIRTEHQANDDQRKEQGVLRY